ncbi:ATP-binding protein [Microbacterium sp. Mu-80]|uniref:ATP-binding protein n=1 Tax=Microbacterium bandirmense TaxID=3122050 RepID=A0ABU8LEJ9_9MICO
MNMLDGFADDLRTVPGHPGQWRLSRVELLNWGTFDGHHAVPIAREGHLITGASGSGKSSLLDAIAVVLTPDKWVKFNAAALDGSSRTGDRNKVSYVRGAWSKEADAAYDRAVSTYLRKAATWSGILLRFDDDRNDPVVLVRLFHLKGTTTDPADLKDACVILRRDIALPDFASYAARGLDVRRLKADLDPVVATSSGHGPFYMRMRSLLGIASDNALNLLHKTQAAKNLGSLDALFRTFMLDTPGTFKRVENAVDQFRELSESHSHVVDLRDQAEALGVIDESAVQFDAAEVDMLAGRRLSDRALPFTAQWKLRLAETELHAAKQEQTRAQRAAEAARLASEEAEALHDSAKQRLDKRGGIELSHLRARIDDARARVREVTAARTLLGDRLERVGVPMPSSAGELDELVALALAEASKQTPEAIDFTVNDALSQAQAEVRRLEAEIQALRGNRTNVPADLIAARRKVARSLDLPERALPFAGELIDVRGEFAEWSGAIERVLSPLSTALLVRDDLLARVRRVVDGIHLEARLVLDAVALHVDAPAAVRDDRSVIHRVHVADGPFAAYLHRRLSDEFDYACVDDPDELDGVDRGVTITGLLKRSRRRYEKNDRFRVDDRRRWVLGTDNGDKVDHLITELSAAKRAEQTARARFDHAQSARDVLIKRREVFADITRVTWPEIDVKAAGRRSAALEEQLRILTAPDSEMAEAVKAEQQARQDADRLRNERNELEVAAQLAEGEQRRIAGLIDELRSEQTTPVDDADAADLERRFREVRRSIVLSNIDAVSAQVVRSLGSQVQEADARARQAQADFVGRATHFVDRWEAASAELTPTIEDRAGFRALREGILARGLPEYEARFLALLRDRSRDMVIHLRDELMSAPRRVAERIDPVNESLGRSPYDRGRYLEIMVKTRRSGEVDEFLGDLKRIVEGNWAEEDLAGAEQRFAVLSKVMHRLESSDNADRAWRARVLDTREHVSFLAQEKDAAGRVVAVHDSSAGLSGGQRQKLVIFCLAAALRFQLADPDDLVPSYGTVVLDEAFDKADAQYTRMAMDIFREFGFHMILATPQKLLQTLEPYVGAVTSVSNPTRDQSILANVVIERA